MSWLQRYRVHYYLRNSLWLIPALGMVIGMVLVWTLHWIESVLGWTSTVHPDSARTVLSTLASSIFTLVVFVSSAILVILQMASSQLSPRIIGVILRSTVTKLSIAAFVFTFAVTLASLARIDDSVPLLSPQLANISCIGSLVLFLYMIDHLGKALRPSGVLRSIARLGKETVSTVYPRMFADSSIPVAARKKEVLSEDVSNRVIASSRDGVLLAFDRVGLIELANAARCSIELVPQLGDFVAEGSPLFRLSPQSNMVDASRLRQMVFLGQERAIEHDPTYAFRILVDIAAKALSPGINDPTTAVLAIDQIQHILEAVGVRHLHEGELEDESSDHYLLYRTPNWEDFVQLAVTEIRLFGGDSIQVVRRLRAMLDYLIRTLPKRRSTALKQELSLLDKKAHSSFSEPEDRAMAEVSDMQGVGSGQSPFKR